MPSPFKTSPLPLERFYPAIANPNKTYGTDPNAVDLNRMPTLRQLAQEDAMSGSSGYAPMEQAAWNSQARGFVREQEAEDQAEHVMSQLPKLDVTSEGGKQALDMLLRFNPEAAASPRLRNYLGTQEALARPKKGEIPRGVADAMARYRQVDWNSPDANEQVLKLDQEIDAETAADPNVVRMRGSTLGLVTNAQQKANYKAQKDEAERARKEEKEKPSTELLESLKSQRDSLTEVPEDPKLLGKLGGWNQSATDWNPSPEQIEAGKPIYLAQQAAKYNADVDYWSQFHPSLSKLRIGGQPQSAPPTGSPVDAGTPEPAKAPDAAIKSRSAPSVVPPTPPPDNLTGFEKVQAQANYEAQLRAADKELKTQQGVVEQEARVNKQKELENEQTSFWEPAKQELLKNFKPEYASLGGFSTMGGNEEGTYSVSPSGGGMGEEESPQGDLAALTQKLGKNPNHVAFRTPQGQAVTWGQVAEQLMSDFRTRSLKPAPVPIIPELKLEDNFTIRPRK